MTREKSAAIEIGCGNEISMEHGCGSHLDMGSPAQMSYVDCSAFSTLNIANGHHDAVQEEDECSTPCKATPTQLDLLPGETVEEEATFVDCRLVLTNFRLCIVSLDELSISVVAVMNIDGLDFKDPVHLSIVCKDGKVFRVAANSYEDAIHWHRRLMKCTTRSSPLDAFAWPFAKAVAASSPSSPSCDWLTSTGDGIAGEEKDLCRREWERLDFDRDHFIIYDGNKDHSVIETYPERLIVPRKMTAADLDDAKNFRFLQRLPVVVWKSSETRAVLLRSSQPRCGLFSWRNYSDEKILQLVQEYMAAYTKPGCEAKPKVCIMDARSYAAAWANRAKGGGFESGEYYQGSETVFLSLPNIHNVRYSFVQLRTLLTAVGGIDQANYLQNLQTCNWLHYLNSLMASAKGCVDYLLSGTCVLVHCSDGWDRTTQIVSLAKLMADEYYRTIEGFEELIRREWIEFGHKFADRNGVSGTDMNERSPVFVQWLDAVWQIMRQNNTAFQFNHQYLIKLAQHAYSGMFGSFLFNSQSEARKELKKEGGVAPLSIWRFLGMHNEEIRCYQYDPSLTGRLDVHVGIQHLAVWRECYCTDYPTDPATQTTIESSPVLMRATATTSPPREPTTMQKSKSSESINSLGNSNDAYIGAGSLNSAHSESNGKLNTSPLDAHHSGGMDTSIMTDSVLHRSGVRRSTTSRSTIRRQMLDSDGLSRFVDPVQQQARIQERKRQVLERRLREHEQEMVKLRQRSHSEKTSISDSGRDACGRMTSVGEDSEIDILDRAPSDMSLVDHADTVPTPQGWETNQDQCSICSKKLSNITVSSEYRPHHCRSCGRSVCEACSPHSYHETIDGKGQQRRACTVCYEKMTAGKTATMREDEGDLPTNGDMNGAGDSSDEVSEGAEPRSRTDTMLHKHSNGSSPSAFRSNGCNASQAVKG